MDKQVYDEPINYLSPEDEAEINAETPIVVINPIRNLTDKALVDYCSIGVTKE